MTVVRRKIFSPALYERNDKDAKQAVLGYLNSLGKYEAIENTEDRFGPDIIVHSATTGRHLRYCECEIKYHWKQLDTFPYSTVQVLERKTKFTGLKIPTEFYILHPSCTRAIVIKEKILLASPIVEVPNKYVYSGEMMYQVPLSKCKIVNLVDLV